MSLSLAGMKRMCESALFSQSVFPAFSTRATPVKCFMKKILIKEK